MKGTKQVGTEATFAIFQNLMKRKLPFVFCKWKTEVCFPWSANGDKKCTHVRVHAMQWQVYSSTSTTNDWIDIQARYIHGGKYSGSLLSMTYINSYVHAVGRLSELQRKK